MRIIIHSDGASKGNPGRGYALNHITIDNEQPYENIKLLGNNITNNQAEYEAFILSLINIYRVKQKHKPSIINAKVYVDSKLVHGQLMEGWKVNKNKLLVERAKLMFGSINDITQTELKWIPREENKAGIRLEEIF
jgi:ribonuclease HI